MAKFDIIEYLILIGLNNFIVINRCSRYFVYVETVDII